MLQYNLGKGEFENWLVTETDFDDRFQGKCETIFCMGNGYMGIRCATEENYIDQVRDTFIAGTFNKFDEFEVTELPNTADVLELVIRVDGKRFNLNQGSFSNYKRTLNIKTGEIIREFQWTSTDGKSFWLFFKKFVSMHDRHALSSKISIKALSHNAQIEIQSGINGQHTNTGAQHFHEGEKRIYEKKYMQQLQTTTESKITFFHNLAHDVSIENDESKVKSRFEMDRRKIMMIYDATLEKGQTLMMHKTANVYTTRDNDLKNNAVKELKTFSCEQLKKTHKKGYDILLEKSINEWKKIWDRIDINITSEDHFNQLAIRFAQYHLMVMTPKHDNRMGIGAKGLSGEGYKGHSFWDTELFMLPFFTYTMPEIAKSLLEYRYQTIEGARKKAKENGYLGAMYPWESAWKEEGEVTPVWGAADILTGKSTKIWSGFIEQHITSDIAFAIWQYEKVTGDVEFMEQCGYEILLDTGIFWASRLEWNEEKQEYHINNVIGPDEYKEHINNDAFTNHTAKWCMENMITYYEKLKTDKPSIFNRLNEKLNLEEKIIMVKERLKKLYVPQPNNDLIIPQDDTYLSLKNIDLTQYKNQKHVGSIFLDYNLEQVNQMQVSKQASVVMLMYLLEHKFSKKIKKANYEYYEARTLHDSSLSLSTHAILANDIGDTKLAYDLFNRAVRIDLGENMKTSDHGIHAASLGGVWQIVVCGFGGVRMIDGRLRIDPKLPEKIEKIAYPLTWKGTPMNVEVTSETIKITSSTNTQIEIEIQGKQYQFQKELLVNSKKETV